MIQSSWIEDQIMATVAPPRATARDLALADGKAELSGGRIVEIMATGIRPNEVAGNIYVSLRGHAKKIKKGKAFTDNMGFIVAELSSGRESFSPDASYYDGPLPADLMRFVNGAPKFAAEVRSENDYGPGPEAEQAAKRKDYFEAGTVIVWDVDPKAEVIWSYHRDRPDEPTRFAKNQTADAEQAIPGWRISGDEVFA
jgi:Uma2 family endonuclease